MVSGPVTLWQIEKSRSSDKFIFLGSKITVDGDCSHEIKRHLLLKRKTEKPGQCIEKQRYYFANKSPYSQSYGFSSNHVQMWEWTIKKAEVLKNRCFWIVVWQKTLERHLSSKEIKPVHPKGNQPWIFIGRTDAKAEAAALWPPDGKSRLTGKDPDAGKDWRQEEKWETEDKWPNGIINSMDTSLIKLWEVVKDRVGWRAAVPGIPESQDRISDRTTTSKSTPRTLLWSYTIHSMKYKCTKQCFALICNCKVLAIALMSKQRTCIQ